MRFVRWFLGQTSAELVSFRLTVRLPVAPQLLMAVSMSLAEVATAPSGPSGCHSVDVLWDRLLGRGSFGQVYEGVVYPSGAACAVKTAKLPEERPENFLPFSGAGFSSGHSCASSCDDDGARMLREEASLLSQLKHDNILGCFGVFEACGRQCAVLEYCDGGDFYVFLHQRQEQFFITEVRAFMKQLLSAVACLYHASIAHLDIKPANIKQEREEASQTQRDPTRQSKREREEAAKTHRETQMH